MRLGLNLAVFGDRPLEEALDRSRELGIESVELNCESGDRLTPAAWLLEPANAARLRAELRARDLRLSALGNHAESQLIGGPHHRDTDPWCPGDAAAKAAFGRARLLDTARAAAELEVDTVVGFTGCADWSRFFPWPDPEGWERMLPAFVETWSEILEELTRLGVRFAHEPHPKQLAYDLETSERVTEALHRHPAWGFNLDTANLALTGADPAAFVQALGRRIFHVHAKDFEEVPHNLARSGRMAHGSWGRADRGVRFRVPGWGDVAWRRVISELRLAGYRGVLSIEHEDPTMGRDEGVAQAARFLAPLLLRDELEERWW